MRTSGSRDAPNSPTEDVLLLKALQFLLFCASLSITPARNSTKRPLSELTPALGSTDVQCFLPFFGLPRVEVHEVSSYGSLCSQVSHLSIRQPSSSEQPSEVMSTISGGAQTSFFCCSLQYSSHIGALPWYICSHSGS